MAPSFILESKVGARLTRQQLKRYRRGSGNNLVAITKEYPDEPRRWLKANNIAAIRWQDVYRCLTEMQPIAGVERFLQNSFIEYLEARDMAYAEIYQHDIEKIRGMFRRISGPEKDYGQINFSAATHCLEMLQDVLKDVEDEFPKLANTARWHRWGPAYYKDNDDNFSWHNLAFGWWKRRKGGGYPAVYLGIGFPEDEGKDIVLFGWEDKSESWPTRKMKQFFDKDHRLDRTKFVKAAKSIAKNWQI